MKQGSNLITRKYLISMLMHADMIQWYAVNKVHNIISPTKFVWYFSDFFMNFGEFCNFIVCSGKGVAKIENRRWDAASSWARAPGMELTGEWRHSAGMQWPGDGEPCGVAMGSAHHVELGSEVVRVRSSPVRCGRRWGWGARLRQRLWLERRDNLDNNLHLRTRGDLKGLGKDLVEL